MKLPSAFNADNHEKMGDFTPLPEGKYITMISKSDIILTKKAKKAKEAGDPNFQQKGQMLVLTHTVLAPKAQKGKTISSRLNIINESEVAVEIANKEMATICSAIGKVSVEETDEFHGIPLMISVSVTDDKKYNNIDFYEKVPDDLPDEIKNAVAADPGAQSGSSADGETEKKKRLWD